MFCIIGLNELNANNYRNGLGMWELEKVESGYPIPTHSRSKVLRGDYNA